MRCMKTGVRFSVPAFNDETYHADMFYNATADVAIIRGLGKGTSEQEPDVVLVQNGDAFLIVDLTSELEAQVTKYFPSVKLHELNIIIDDTKFF